MKRKILCLCALAVFAVLLMCGCGEVDGNLTLENGILKWDEIAGATGYEVDLGSGGVAVSQNRYALADNCDCSGEVSVTVRAVRQDNSRTDIGSMKLAVNTLAQPIISVEGEGEDLSFVWSGVENATGYIYDAHDSNGTVPATADEDGKYRVQITNLDEQMIRVTAVGGSEDDVVYASNDCLYRYSSSRVFDLSLIGEHPAVYYATGVIGSEEILKVGTTLPKGTYTMTVSLYASTVSGDKLKGNGTWGRRIVDIGKPKVHLWLCEEAPNEYYPEAENSIPYPDEVITVQMLVNVDHSSNANLICHDFDQGDMVVIKDLVVDGKSVLNDQGGAPNPEIVIDPFDVSKVGSFLAYYRGVGDWVRNDNWKPFTIRIPTKLSDGMHYVKVNYYVCGPQGELLTGNGMWGRRVQTADAKSDELCWIIENDVEQYKATDIPFPTKRDSYIFDVEVKNGWFELRCLDFNKDEYFIVESVQPVAPEPGSFDTSKIGSYLASYRGLGEWMARDESNRSDFTVRIPTNLADGEHAVQVNYYVCGPHGEKLTGNGMWGRRVYVYGSKDNQMLWLNAERVNDYMPVELPKGSERNSFVFDVEVKDGYFELMCADFEKNEYFIVESVERAPLPEGSFDLSTLENYLVSYRGLGEWMARDESNRSDFVVRIPTDLPDGEQSVQVNYYVCGNRGQKLTGNGMWGRRIQVYGAKDAQMLWLNETQVNNYAPVVLPEATELRSFVFDVEVKDGYFELLCFDLNKDEYFIVESVEKAPLPDNIFDITTIDSYLASYRGLGEWGDDMERFAVHIPTNLNNGKHTIRVNYYLCGPKGEKLTGNGMWGRRVYAPGAKDAQMLWLNETQVNDYAPVVLPEATVRSSFELDVEVKDGYIHLLCLDFNKDEYFIVESVEHLAGKVDVESLTFVDTSNGFVFDAETDADLLAVFGTEQQLSLKAQYQYSEESSGEAAKAELAEVQLTVSVDSEGRLCMSGVPEEAGIKLVIPAGSVIAPVDTAAGNVQIVIAKELILERNAESWGTKDGWEQSQYTDVTLTFQNASNGYIFKVDTAADLVNTYGTWKALDLTVQVQYGENAGELENAGLTDVQAYFCVDEQGRFLLYGAQEYRSARLVIPAGTIITPSDKALSDVKLRITNDIELIRDASNWGSANGWHTAIYTDVKLTFRDSVNGLAFVAETTEDLKAVYGAWKDLNVEIQTKFSTASAQAALDAALSPIAARFNVDDNGRLCLYSHAQGCVKIVIPAGTIITPSDKALSNVALRITNDIVLERDAAYWQTNEGWVQTEDKSETQ